jgi:hypothetical protein
VGKIRISDDNEIREIPIPEICLVGRHWSCQALFTAPQVPYFWLELRWLEQNWAWRPLNLVDDTRGTGSVGSNGWRVLGGVRNRRPRIAMADNVWLEFIDLAPPAAFAQNVETNDIITGDALEDLWECVDDRFYRFNWEEVSETESELKNGDMVSSGNALYRVFFPVLGAATLVAQLHLFLTDCSVSIDVQRLTASFDNGQATVEVYGECVRVLAAYALARRDEAYSDGGWLTATESYTRWLELGGNPTSSADRLGSERGKLRNQLRRAGILDVKDCFERQTSGYRTMLRLAIKPDQIFMDDNHLS